MSDQPDTIQALSGLFALIVLIISTVIFTLLRPGYNHLTKSFSELGELYAPNYIVFNFISFGVVGVLSLYFYRSVLRYYDDHETYSLSYSYSLASISWIITGIFPVSYDIDWLYVVHLAAAFCSYLLGCLSIALSIRLFTEVEGFEIFSILTAWCLFVVWGSILTSFTTLTPELGQLVSIFTYFTWQAGYSVQFYRVINRK